VDDFLDDLRWSNRSLNTLRSYRLDLLHFLKGHPGLKVHELTPPLLRDSLATVAATASPQTVARRLSALRSFCRFLVREHQLPTNPCDTIEGVKLPQALPRARSRAELHRLFAVIKQRRDPVGKRDLALFLLPGIRSGRSGVGRAIGRRWTRRACVMRAGGGVRGEK